MSDSDIDLVHRFWAAFNDRDLTGLEACSPTNMSTTPRCQTGVPVLSVSPASLGREVPTRALGSQPKYAI